MPTAKPPGPATAPARLPDAPAAEHYVLRLYVTGATPHSVRAIENVQQLCERYLAGRYSLEVIDLYQQPHLAHGDRIVAAPTLVRALPLPLRRISGDLSDPCRVLAGLDLMRRAP